MPDWTKPMEHTFEYYEVDPRTWKDKKLINTVKSNKIVRDSSVDTLGSASIDINEAVGECYIRTYLVTTQNGVTEKHPLGTHLVQTPASSFDGRVRNVSMDAYTPLIELKENPVPIGYYIPKTEYHKVVYDADTGKYTMSNDTMSPVTGEEVVGVKTVTGEQVFKQDTEDQYYCMIELPVDVAYRLLREQSRSPDAYHKVVYDAGTGRYTVSDKTIPRVIGGEAVDAITITGEQVYKDPDGQYYCTINPGVSYGLLRAPVVKPNSSTPLHEDFVADTEDTWFSYIHGLIAKVNHEFDFDEQGRVLLKPKQDTASLQPVWTYNDDNSSILYPELDMDHDLYMVPNVVEVIYFDGRRNMIATARNDDENSPTSTVRRGRQILHRVTEPDIPGIPTQKQLDDYAVQVLRDMSTVEYTVSYSHGYCPVRLGDCVRLNYTRAGITDVKARVVYQSIECKTGCKVSEKAVYTTRLWR